MTRATSFYSTTVGKKLVMAVTGIILFLFIVGHLLGNLQIFMGPKRINDYAAFLKSTGELLWIVRGVLLIALILHIVAAVQVTLANWKARPQKYVMKKSIEADYASRTMVWTGPIIFLYLLFHLAMFTFLWTGPGYSHTDVYANVISAFQQWPIALIYIVAMLCLGFHLYHGLWSMFQTLGVNNPKINYGRRVFSVVFSVLITLGYISIPASVLLGIVK
ncbi:MAG: succinate dehydrogenase cytochrome b subunit [Acidobacteriota bacterium]|jgi:succinate dehydrogenase / fumarate reductase, cytochrome b subunit